MFHIVKVTTKGVGLRCRFQSIFQSTSHRLIRTAYLYDGCLAWYNVILTSRAHSSVTYSQQSTVTCATVE